MSDEEFIKMLTILSKRKTLTQKSANTTILKYFDYDDQDGNTLIRKVVPEQLKTLKKEFLEESLKMINIIYALLYKNHGTLDSILTKDVRGIIAKRYQTHSAEHTLAKKTAKLSYKDKGALIKKKLDARSERHKEVIKFDGKTMLEHIQENIESDNVLNRAVALALACGSRPIELCAKSTYVVEDEHWVRQDFIAKSKSRDHVIKPIIFLSAQRFVEEVARMRIDLAKRYKTIIKDEELYSSVSSACNTATKKILGPEHTYNSCRKEYIQLSYELFGRFPNRYGESVSDDLWKQMVLGHAQNDFGTGSNYSNYKLENKGNGELDLKVDLLEVKVEHIEDTLENGTELKVASRKVEKAQPIQSEKVKRQYAALDTIKENFEKNNKKRLTQNEMEILTKDKIPRTIVRLYMAKIREESLY
jgi:hypothetical protein